MDVPEQVEAYLTSQPEPKQADLRRLHAHILAEFPGCRLWFTDGTNADGKVVANPNIGYGAYTITWHLLSDPAARFTDLGPDWHDRLAPLRRKRQLIAELERLSGKKVTLHDAA